MAEIALGPVAVQNFSPIGAGMGTRPQKVENFHFLVKSSRAGANP